MSLRTPLGRVLGLGSAHEGVHHWVVQRVSAVALVVLTVWFVLSLVRLPLGDHAQVTAWMADGIHPVLLALLVLTGAWHSKLGVQVVIEDYVHQRHAKMALLIVNTFAHVLVAAAAVLAVLRVALRSFG
ncbi:MAG: succinate dehydrogenase, hydrophobic membrane anchor protein [Steroidobacteraceae bacterium]